MKRIAFISLLCALGCLTGCDKREIMLYEERAGVYFSLNSQAYSFLENVGDTVHVVRVPVTVTGTASDKDRIVKAGLPDVDLNTTAEDDQYVIGDGLVKAGELGLFGIRNLFYGRLHFRAPADCSAHLYAFLDGGSKRDDEPG